MHFSLFFFSSRWPDDPGDHYKLFRDSVQFADTHGFEAIWTPERHFDPFGGLFPNPAVTGAAAAMMTERVGIRAGSVVIPLQDPIRVAEEWSVVDNLSHGRVGVSFASGWNVNDFVLSPQNYTDRKTLMYDGIEVVRKLWRGEPVRRPNGAERDVDIHIYPRPVQPEIPIWLTAQSDRTCVKAGEMGTRLLTNMNHHDMDELPRKIKAYTQSLAQHGLSDRKHVTLMVHTFIGDEAAIHTTAKPAYAEYVRTHMDLQSQRAMGYGAKLNATEEEIRFIVARAVDRMIHKVGLIGTPEQCLEQARRFQQVGVDEIACLIDFGADAEAIMSSLEHVIELRRSLDASSQDPGGPGAPAAALTPAAEPSPPAAASSERSSPPGRGG